MRYSFLALILMATVCSAAEFRNVDGKSEYAKYSVDGVSAWSEAEKDSFVSRMTRSSGTVHTPTVVEVQLTQFEATVSSCIPSFKNNTELQDCLSGNKSVLLEKLVELDEGRDRYKADKRSEKYIHYDSKYTPLLKEYEKLP